MPRRCCHRVEDRFMAVRTGRGVRLRPFVAEIRGAGPWPANSACSALLRAFLEPAGPAQRRPCGGTTLLLAAPMARIQSRGYPKIAGMEPSRNLRLARSVPARATGSFGNSHAATIEIEPSSTVESIVSRVPLGGSAGTLSCLSAITLSFRLVLAAGTLERNRVS
jgi:hypothetical protein